MPTAADAGRAVALCFFASHIPVTLFVDSQVVFPRAWYPAWATAAMDWYLKTYRDPLMVARPPWFVALVWMEVLVQLPFFVYALAAFSRRAPAVRKPAAAYGISTATTLVPILAELAASAPAATRATLIAFYVPYLVVPLGIGWWMLAAVGDPFGGRARKGGAAKAKRRRG